MSRRAHPVSRTCGALAALVVVLVACGQGSGASGVYLDRVQRGVEAYSHALETEDRDARIAAFRTAERFFASAAGAGVATPDLYANLGNAALGAGRLGPAVLAFRRALQLDPDHGRALQNLEHARGQLPAWVPRRESVGALDSFFFWHRTLSRAQRRALSAWSFLLAAGLVAWSLRTRQSTPRNLAWVPGGLWLALVASLLLDPASQARTDVVITAAEVQARAADSALAPPLFAEPLPGGTEARLLEERSPWARIRLANGREVWVTRSSLTRVLELPGASNESPSGGEQTGVSQ